MHRLIRTCASAFLLLAAGAAYAATADFQEGVAAFDRGDYAEALKRLEPIAAAGDADAQFRVAQMLRYGWGTTADAAAAGVWMRRAAEAGLPDAQAELGRMLRDGNGMKANPAEALTWLKRAAERGSGVAQLNLGRMYRNGVGTTRDRAQAYKWFTLAAQNGFMDGIASRNVMAESMTPEEIAAGERLVKEAAR
jgi:TPR repeat protein